jgi:hypothetical protein
MADRLNQNELDEAAPVSGSYVRSERRAFSEPDVTVKEWVAYAVILIMVCGPLAMGAFGL